MGSCVVSPPRTDTDVSAAAQRAFVLKYPTQQQYIDDMETACSRSRVKFERAFPAAAAGIDAAMQQMYVAMEPAAHCYAVTLSSHSSKRHFKSMWFDPNPALFTTRLVRRSNNHGIHPLCVVAMQDALEGEYTSARDARAAVYAYVWQQQLSGVRSFTLDTPMIGSVDLIGGHVCSDMVEVVSVLDFVAERR